MIDTIKALKLNAKSWDTKVRLNPSIKLIYEKAFDDTAMHLLSELGLDFYQSKKICNMLNPQSNFVTRANRLQDSIKILAKTKIIKAPQKEYYG